MVAGVQFMNMIAGLQSPLIEAGEKANCLTTSCEFYLTQVLYWGSGDACYRPSFTHGTLATGLLLHMGLATVLLWHMGLATGLLSHMSLATDLLLHMGLATGLLLHMGLAIVLLLCMGLATGLLLHMGLYSLSGLLSHMGLDLAFFYTWAFTFHLATWALTRLLLQLPPSWCCTAGDPVSSIFHSRHYKSSAHGCTWKSRFYTKSAPFPVSSLQHLTRGRVLVAVCTHLAVAAPPPPELAEMTFVIITTWAEDF